MTHLPFVAASYGLGAGVPALLAVLAWRRLGQARRRLTVIDPRGSSFVNPRGASSINPRGASAP